MVSVRFMELQTAALNIGTKHCAHLSLVVHLFARSLQCPMFWLVFFMLLDVSAIWRTLSTEAVS